MLADIPKVNSKQFRQILKFAVHTGDNIMVLGPSGAGKTIITQDVAKEEKCRLIYINLSTLERTDFQGFPVVSDDKDVVRYATPEFMPFADASTAKEKRLYRKLFDRLEENEENNDVRNFCSNRLEELDRIEKAHAALALLPYVRNHKNIEKRLKQILDFGNIADEQPVVILFDEVDKAASETNQPLLELLQFGSINGRKLNLRACILTGNLPDENAHSNNISHAITKRCKVFELCVDFEQWKSWAFKNDVHDHILQFLATEPTLLFVKSTNDDPTDYAKPAPRTWTQAGRSLTKIDSDKMYQAWPAEDLDELKKNLISGNVGLTAATKFEVWYKFFRELEPAITALVEKGIFPKDSMSGRSWTDTDHLIIAISACSQQAKEIKDNNTEKLNKVTNNVYKWLTTISEEQQVAATRMSFSLSKEEDFHAKVTKYKLLEIPSFRNVFDMLNKKFKQYNVTKPKSKNKD